MLPPLSLVQQRAKRALALLEERVARGELPTVPALLLAATETVLRFTTRLGQPQMQVPVFRKDGPLIATHVVEPLRVAREDLEVAAEQAAELAGWTTQLANLSQSERAGLDELLREVTATVDNFRLWVSDSVTDFLWSGDTFADASKLDPSSSVHLDPVAGLVSLAPVSSTSLNDQITAARIDPVLSAGGLPGNNLEILDPGTEAFTGGRPEPAPVRYRDVLPRSDQLAALWDHQPDTWFDWERNYIPVPQPTLRAGKALVADPGGKPNRKIPRLPGWKCFRYWPGQEQLDTGVRRQGYPLAYFTTEDRQPLRLALEWELATATRLSWLQLTPLVRGQAYPVVEQLLVSNDSQTWRRVVAAPLTLHPRMNRGVNLEQLAGTGTSFEGTAVIPLPDVPLRYFKLILRQDRSYSCPLGMAHQFFVREGQRVQGAVPTVGSSAALPGEAPAVDYALSDTRTRRKVREAYDVLAGERQAIGLRELSLEARVYRETGTLLSTAHHFAQPLRAVALLTAEEWPAEWGDGEWSSYEVSADGEVWSALVPQKDSAEEAFVRFEQPTTTVYLRVSLQRPTAQLTTSPFLRAYVLKGLAA